MKSITLLVSVLVLSLVSAACFDMGFDDEGTGKEKEEFRQTYNLSAGGSVSLKNVNGSVKIRAWDDQKVEVKALKKGPTAENIQQVKIEVNASNDSVTIDTIYPKVSRNLNVSVAYEISVPRNANLKKVETVNGSVEITDVQGRIEANSVNGSITISGSRGAIDAETVNGSIKATMDELSTTEKTSFETVNGSLNLFLPENANAELEVDTTNGKINSEFQLTVEGKYGPKQARGKIGQGGAKLDLETVNGSININKAKKQ